MYERYTQALRRTMRFAHEQAAQLFHDHIGTEHLLLGMLEEPLACIILESFERLGLDINLLKTAVKEKLNAGREREIRGMLPQTPYTKKVIQYAMEEARDMNLNYIGIEHLLLGLIRVEECVAAQVLKEFGVTLEQVRRITKPEELNPETRQLLDDLIMVYRAQNLKEAVQNAIDLMNATRANEEIRRKLFPSP